MGCCQSKLLGIQPTPQKYQNNPIQQISNYCGQLVSIEPVLKKRNTHQVNFKAQQQQSLCFHIMELNLQEIVNRYERKQGKITYTCLMDPEVKTIRSQKNSEKKNIEIAYINNEQNSSQQENTSNTCSQLQTQQIVIKQKPTFILKNLTIDKISNLQKQLFWNEFSQINGIVFEKWSEQNRQPILITMQQLMKLNFAHQLLWNICCLLVFYVFQSGSQIKLINYHKNYNGKHGLRIHVNGYKRLFPINQIDYSDGFGSKLVLNYLKHCNESSQDGCTNTSELLYYLTGWIPQNIEMNQIQSHSLMFQRLKNSLQNQNVLISFINPHRQQAYIVKNINVQNLQIQAIHLQKMLPHQSIFQYNVFPCQILNNDETVLMLNWNPTVYYSINKLDFQILAINEDKNLQYQQQKYPQIMLELPPANDQIQIRILLQQHSHTYKIKPETRIQLYEYSGDRRKALKEQPIKTYEMNSKFLTDVMLFESCSISNRYIMVIIPENIAQKNRQFSISFYSATQIRVQKLKPSIDKSELLTYITLKQQNCGYGLNSPFYHHNAQFNLKIPPCHLLKIKTTAQKQIQKLKYQISFIPNSKNAHNLFELDLIDLADINLISPIFNTLGTIQIEPQVLDYYVIINLFQISQQCNIKFEFQCLDVQKQKLNYHEILKQQMISFSPIESIAKQIIYRKQFVWNKKHPGLRNRTKENTQNTLMRKQIFKIFFENPYIDIKLQQGRYNFLLHSKSYRQSFIKMMNEIDKNSSQQKYEQRNNFRPSNLSLAIFQIEQIKINTEKQQKYEKRYKIILDDEFYVPFGMGFFSKQIKLISGEYRFVFSKIQKSHEEGVFQILKIIK